MKYEGAGFLKADCHNCQRYSFIIHAWFYSAHSPTEHALSWRFNMASPFAFRLGVKNAGRLTNLFSLTPKVCLFYSIIICHPFCVFPVNSYCLLTILNNIDRSYVMIIQGKAGVLACKRFGSTALSYEQVNVFLVLKKNAIIVFKTSDYTELAIKLVIVGWWKLTWLYKFMLNRPFYSCGLSTLECESMWGWRWPCFETNLLCFVMEIVLEKF